MIPVIMSWSLLEESFYYLTELEKERSFVLVMVDVIGVRKGGQKFGI